MSDNNAVTREELEVERDAEAVPELAEDQDQVVEEEPAKTDYIEFVGDKVHGTVFYGELGTHGVTRKHFREVHDIETPKDLTWKRGKGGRFLVPVTEMSSAAAELLEADPMFKRVSL